MLAVAATHTVITAAGACPARAIAAGLPRRAWQRYSAGEGAKGHRYYDWAWLAIDPGRTGHRYLLIRRSRRTGELAFYRCYSPRPGHGRARLLISGSDPSVTNLVLHLALTTGNGKALERILIDS